MFVQRQMGFEFVWKMVKNRIAGVICAAGMILLVCALLLLPLHIVGTDGGLYYRLQLREGILPEAGVTEDELRSVDSALAAYLSGDRGALDDVPFNDIERAHMADCYYLFALLRRVLLMCAIAGVLLTAAGIILGARTPDRTFLICAAAFAGMLIILAIWGCVDFASLFDRFHRVLFTNDLWLLNPETDLLIRICPEGMFASMAVRIGLYWLGLMAALYILFRIIVRRRTNAEL